MTFRRNIIAAVGLALLAFGLVAQAPQNRCAKAKTKTLGECVRLYAHNYQYFNDADIKKWGKAVQVADYSTTNASKGCDSVADLVTKVKATAKKAFATANDTSALEPHAFVWGKPLLLDTAINGDTVISTVYGRHDILLGAKTWQLVMIEDNISNALKFETIMHELTHVADTSATEADIAKVEDCVRRRPDKEKPKPKISGGGNPPQSSPGPTIEYEEGYCEYEKRVYCDRDEDGNTQDPCYVYWVKVYCTHIV